MSGDIIENGLLQWDDLKQKYSEEMGLTKTEYESEVSQWRNLWHSEQGVFRQLVYSEGSMILHGNPWIGPGQDFYMITQFANPTKVKMKKFHGIKIPCFGLSDHPAFHLDSVCGCDSK